MSNSFHAFSICVSSSVALFLLLLCSPLPRPLTESALGRDGKASARDAGESCFTRDARGREKGGDHFQAAGGLFSSSLSREQASEQAGFSETEEKCAVFQAFRRPLPPDALLRRRLVWPSRSGDESR